MINKGVKMMICKLDCLGMTCADALALTQKTAKVLPSDEKLLVVIDCPCSAKTIPSWARKNGFYVELESVGEDRYHCLIERI
jgi:TusA-related sulfurtransferase